MSTLANTTWRVDLSGEIRATIRVLFNETGTAYITFPNNTASTADWAEGEDGSFLFRLPQSSHSSNLLRAFFGTYIDNTGTGQWKGNDNANGVFIMTKQ